jgi:hypothetical protein
MRMPPKSLPMETEPYRAQDEIDRATVLTCRLAYP